MITDKGYDVKGYSTHGSLTKIMVSKLPLNMNC